MLFQPMILVILTLISIYDITATNSCDVILFNRDFEHGTYRIRKSGVYCLGEDISMNPHRASFDDPNKYGAWFPIDEEHYPGSTTHDDGGFALGFFSAISIETSDVTVDLKGFEIEMAREFYIQQRWFNCIQIQNAAFNFGQGPANFGQTSGTIQNIRIVNGILGRSSHNGLHGFDVINAYISDLKIHKFEVAGLQFNGFKDVTIHNVDIGPSSTEVPFWGYYSHGRFSLNGFELLNDEDISYIRFKNREELTIKQIYINLRRSLDIAYRSIMNVLTEDDLNHPLYKISIALYQNEYGLPDGSSLYGMVFNSRGAAVQGFGDSENESEFDGNILNIENVNIIGLTSHMNEIAALYLDRCEGHFFNENDNYNPQSISLTPVLGRFGDVIDIGRTLSYEQWNLIDSGFYSYSDLQYVGNPLSDAQIALNIFSDAFETNWGIQQTEDTNRGKETLFRWATQNNNNQYDSLPKCARFACNGDAMFHTNKGIIGVRLDGIEQVKIKNLMIKDLKNESPLGSLACGSYTGPNNGQAQPRGLEREGFMGADIRGISIINGEMIDLYGNIILINLISDNGDVIGIHLMDDAKIYIDEPQLIQFNNLIAGAMITQQMYNSLLSDNISPYPNNFYSCNMRIELLENRENYAYPVDFTEKGKGYIFPKGAVYPQCNPIYEYSTQSKQRNYKFVN